MYPSFEEIAKEEGLKQIARMFKAIGKVEVEHKKEYLELKQALINEDFYSLILKRSGYVKFVDMFIEVKSLQVPLLFVRWRKSISKKEIKMLLLGKFKNYYFT